MRINKSESTSVNTQDSSFTNTYSGVHFSDTRIGRRFGKHMDIPDPSRWLGRRAAGKWKRLPEEKKKKFLADAQRDVEAGREDRNGREAKALRERERRRVEEERKEGKRTGKTGTSGVTVSDDTAGTIRAAGTIRTARTIGAAGTTEENMDRTAIHMGKATGNEKNSPSSFSMPAEGSMAMRISKKAAERFQKSLDEKEERFSKSRERRQASLEQQLQEARESQSLWKAAEVAFSAGGVVAATMVTLVLQGLASIVSMVALLLVPIISMVTIVAAIAVLFASIFAAGDDTTTYSGEDIVLVALGEVGYKETPTNITKYGKWIGQNGEPWCHSFVSWCADQCGYISTDVIPKTASCETGRKWFMDKSLYRTRASGYEPSAGDIIYFETLGGGVAHHVGIVEYVENGIVHTIEGNTSSMVAQRHYSLTNGKIMGYGTPQYPEYAGAAGDITKFLSECGYIADYIVDEGDWIYSNNNPATSWAKAVKAEPKRTNCADYVCWSLQRAGVLKAGEVFYSDDQGKLVIKGSTKKRATIKTKLENTFDILSVGGKSVVDCGLKPGDICLYKGHTNVYIGTKNGKMNWYDFGRGGTSDQKANSGYFVRKVRTSKVSQKVMIILRWKTVDSYGTGKTIVLPKGLGEVHSYMGWSMITSKSSAQYKLRKKYGEKYDADGFGKIGDRYVIACTTTFGKVGDEVDFVLSNGKVIHGIIGEIKNQADSDCNKWGHLYGKCVVEFCVRKSTWYHTSKTVDQYHPEWKATIVKAVNLGKNHL